MRRACIDSVTTSWPKTLTSPASASTSVDSVLINVDLPEPLAPIKPKIEPRATSKETSSMARTRRRGFFEPGRRQPGENVLDRPRTDSGSSGETTGERDMEVVLIAVV